MAEELIAFASKQEMLAKSKQFWNPDKTQFWIDSGLDDIFTRAESLGANVLQRPYARPWGHRDFMVADPDGNVVWVTTPIVTTAG